MKQQNKKLSVLRVIAERLGAESVAALSMESIVHAHVGRVLDACGWNRSLAAEALGTHRRTLQRMLRDYERQGRPLREPDDAAGSVRAQPMTKAEVQQLAKLIEKRMFGRARARAWAGRDN